MILESPRLLFRPHLQEDREASIRLDRDPRFRHPFPALSIKEAERSFDSWLQPKALGLLATIHKTDHRYIGRCGLYPHLDDQDRPIPDEATIAFYLAPEYWGLGLATEAGLAFIEYGLGRLNLRRIVAGASVENLASNRVLEKIGMRRTGSGGKGANGGPAWHAYEILPKA